MLCKYGKQARDFWGVLFLVSSYFLYFGGFFNKTIFHSRLLDMRLVIAGQLGPTGLVSYLPSHIQRALME